MEKIWLLKKLNQVTGPYTLEEIASMVTCGEVSLDRDEVTRPLMRWVYARCVPQLQEARSQTHLGQTSSFEVFASTKEKLMNVLKMKPKEETIKPLPIMEDTSDESPEDDDIDSTEQDTQTATLKYENTKAGQVPTAYGKLRINPSNVDQARTLSYKEIKTLQPTKMSQAGDLGEIHNVRKSVYIRVEKISQWLWGAIALAGCVGAVTYFLYTEPLTKEELEILDPAVLFLQNARHSFEAGDYKNALNLFAESSLTNHNDLVNYASLVAQIDYDSYKARDILDKLPKDSRINRGRQFIIEGLLFLQEQNISAAKNKFTQARSVTVPPVLPLFHLSQIEFQRKNLKKANQYLNLIINKWKAPHSLTFLFQSIYNNKHLNTLNQLTNRRVDYSQEASLLSLYFKSRLSKSVSRKSIIQVLNQDPFVTAEHRFDILSYSSIQLWQNHLLDKCRSIYQKNTEEAYMITLYSFCLAQSDSILEANQTIERARALRPKDPIVLSMDGYITSKNEFEFGQLSIDRAIEYNRSNYVLPFILKARLCEKQEDWLCADKYWSRVQDIEQNSVSALAWQVKSLIQEEDFEEAKALLKKGFKISAKYIPFLSLHQELE